MNTRQTRAGLGLLAIAALGMTGAAAQNMHYDPTLESLDKHPLPQWYADAKLGIFIHWGLYSVPGWAAVDRPKVIPHEDEAKWNAYAEWYYNTVNLGDPGNGNVDSVAFSPDGTTLAIGDDHGGPYLWKTR